MAYLEAEHDDGGVAAEQELVLGDVSPATEADSLINTRGTSLNYVLHQLRTGGPFCADRDSLRGEE
jgi:hypothetical protein